MDNNSNKILVVNSGNKIIFPKSLQSFPQKGTIPLETLREYFSLDKTFVSSVFSLNGKYYGTLCEYLRFIHYVSSDDYSINCKGLKKVEIKNFIRGESYFDLDYCEIEVLDSDFENVVTTDYNIRQIDKINFTLQKIRSNEIAKHNHIFVNDIDINYIQDWIVRNLEFFSIDVQKELFAESDIDIVLEIIANSAKKKLYELEIEEDIQDKVNDDINKDQKEYYLRSQLKVINKELNGEDDFEDLREKVSLLDAPTYVKERLNNEINKISTLMPGSPEAYVSRNYVELVSSLPWGVYTRDNTSIENARKILNEDHYGIEEVKERVLEFLAIHKLTHHKKGNILCFYGPPGTGKTSIVKSIAKALGRKYVRISLGGMHDEAEIRGHRRTYLASMPGKIVTSIKSAGTMNPVFLMDEIDKLSNDYKGDPASALLEVLDPEQNKAYVDNFLDLPFDLSQVLFVTTANDISTIAKPLLDRMELIEMGSYTTEEKEQISLRYLIPKQIKENGIPENVVSFQKQAITDLILNYTREAGVRGLEQTISKVCRKIAVQFGDKPFKKYIVTPSRLQKLLGSPISTREPLRKNEVGVITGLAYTSYGGCTMDMEGLLCIGKGELKLTGSLGDVMKESAQQALTLVKSRAEQYGINQQLFQKDLHINATEGAVPKDGPSAGIALTTLILSVYTQRKIRADVALTGEITLSGRVLPIGGVKEKSMGAINRGISTVVLPKANQKDVEKLSDNIKSKLKYIFVENIDQVFEVMFDET